MAEFINIADLVNPKTGNTYRQDNLTINHKIPIGALVEIQSSDGWPTPEAGIRLYVVAQTRDCDGTPLYSLGVYDREEDNVVFLPRFHGYSEESLKEITL